MLRDAGVSELFEAYGDEPLSTAPDWAKPTVIWFHGLAALVAAEHEVNSRSPETAAVGYARCIERFDSAIEAAPNFASSAAHYQCLASAGFSRLLAENGNYPGAVTHITLSFEFAPDSLDQADGLGKTPRQTARELLQLLKQVGEEKLAARVAGLLD